ncbi:MAG: hypothetical protein WD885_01365 [Candidatus Saccharimonadales bacterium]
MLERFLLFAQKPTNCDLGNNGADCQTILPRVLAGESELRTGLSIVFAVVAGVALISLMIAALNYVTAFSDQDKIARSRRNIIYSLIGLLIALSAEAIVLTVVGKL